MGVCKRCIMIAGALDLRFPDKADEASFKKHIEPQLVRNGAIVSGTITLLILFATFVRLFAEKRLSDDSSAVEWSSADPRTWHFVIYFSNAALQASCCLCLALRGRRGWLQALDVEMVVVCSISVACVMHLLATRPTIAMMFGVAPREAWRWGDARVDELIQYHAVGLLLTTMCTLVPIRSHRMWLISAPCSVLSVAFWLRFGTALEDQIFPTSLILFVVMVAFVTFGAWQKDQFARMKWLTVRSLQQSCENQETEIHRATALVESMQAVAVSHCDVIVKLDEQLKVWHPDRCLKGFFGKQMDGSLFTEVLAEDDHTRFMSLLGKTSSELPLSIPVTISTCSHSRHQASLLVVSTGQALPSYLVGISVAEDQALSDADSESIEGLRENLGDALPGMVPFNPARHHPASESEISFNYSCTDTFFTQDKANAGAAAAPPKVEVAEVGTQVDPILTFDRDMNTSVTWWDEYGFVCTACMKPPQIGKQSPMARSRDLIANNRGRSSGRSDRSKSRSSSRKSRCSDAEQPRSGSVAVNARSRSKDSYSSGSTRGDSPRGEALRGDAPRRDSFQCFDGDWVLCEGYPGVNRWLTSLQIQGNNVIDGNGDLVLLDWSQGCPRLCGAPLTLTDGALHRHGNSGTLFVFHRREPPQDT